MGSFLYHPTSMSSFSSTKNASPLSPSFMWRFTGSPLISMSTWPHPTASRDYVVSGWNLGLSPCPVVALTRTPLYHLLESTNSVCNASEKTRQCSFVLSVYLKVFKNVHVFTQYKLRSYARSKNCVASINVRLQTELRYPRHRHNYSDVIT